MNAQAFYILIKETIEPAYRSHRFSLSDEDCKHWFKKFEAFPDKAVAHSVEDWVNTNSFPPTPADILALVSSRLRSRPGDYGWKPSWQIPNESTTKKLKSMPPHVRAHYRDLIQQAEQLKQQGVVDKRDGGAIHERKAEPTAEEREAKRRELIADYVQRHYVERDGKFVRRREDLVSRQTIWVNGLPCQINKYRNGYEEVTGLEVPEMKQNEDVIAIN